MDGDLISRKALIERYGEPCHSFLDVIETMPAVDAVPRAEYEGLLKRFRHLLESDFIASFAEVEPFTGKYKRDIAEADKVQPVRHSKWVCRAPGVFSCGECFGLALGNRPTRYCPDCGARMDLEDMKDGKTD